MKKSERPNIRTYRTVGLTFLLVMALMFIYQEFKQIIWPNISIWQSHVVTILFTAFLASIAVYCSLHWLKREQARQEVAVEAHRLRVLRATMTTVHGIVNNFLQNVQLLILRQQEGEMLSAEEQGELNSAVQDTFMRLKQLGDLDKVPEKTLVGGRTGIDYEMLNSQSEDMAEKENSLDR